MTLGQALPKITISYFKNTVAHMFVLALMAGVDLDLETIFMRYMDRFFALLKDNVEDISWAYETPEKDLPVDLKKRIDKRRVCDFACSLFDQLIFNTFLVAAILSKEPKIGRALFGQDMVYKANKDAVDADGQLGWKKGRKIDSSFDLVGKLGDTVLFIEIKSNGATRATSRTKVSVFPEAIRDAAELDLSAAAWNRKFNNPEDPESGEAKRRMLERVREAERKLNHKIVYFLWKGFAYIGEDIDRASRYKEDSFSNVTIHVVEVPFSKIIASRRFLDDDWGGKDVFETAFDMDDFENHVSFKIGTGIEIRETLKKLMPKEEEVADKINSMFSPEVLALDFNHRKNHREGKAE